MARRDDDLSDAGAEILDAEFERVAVAPASEKDETASAASKVGAREEAPKSWLEWSLEADPELNSTRVPFFDPRAFDGNGDANGADSIDVRLAFLVELDGETYGIGAPFDHAVALTVETKGGGERSNSVEYLPPIPDNEELMEIMASQLHDSVSPTLRLVNTPRVLTVRGPLDEFTSNWSTDVFPKPLTASQLLDETDEDVAEFLRFMKKELGEAEYEDALRGSSLAEEDRELLGMFDIPGLGDRGDDEEGIQDLFRSMLDPPSAQQQGLRQLRPAALDGSRNAALRLVSYILPDSGKVYSLVSLLEPYVLVAKRVSLPVGDANDGDDDDGVEAVRFELPSPSEERVLIPRLEQVCRADLEKAGLQLRAAPQPPPSLEP